MADSAVALLRKWESVVTSDRAASLALVSPDCQLAVNGLPIQVDFRPEVEGVITLLKPSFPDLRFAFSDLSPLVKGRIVEVALTVTITGNFTGQPFGPGGLPPVKRSYRGLELVEQGTVGHVDVDRGLIVRWEALPGKGVLGVYAAVGGSPPPPPPVDDAAVDRAVAILRKLESVIVSDAATSLACLSKDCQLVVQGFPVQLDLCLEVEGVSAHLRPSFPDLTFALSELAPRVKGHTIEVTLTKTITGTFTGLPYSPHGLPPVARAGKPVTLVETGSVAHVDAASGLIVKWEARPGTGLLGVYAAVGGTPPAPPPDRAS